MNFVLDASVALTWCFEDETNEYGEAVLDGLQGSEAVAPSLWLLEVVNALLTAERRGRIDLSRARQLLNFLRTLPIVIEPTSRRRAFESVHVVARKHRLSSYDAGYLELAIESGLPVATLDGALRAAVEAEGLELFRPK